MIDTIVFDLGKVLVDFHPKEGMRAIGFSEDAIKAFMDNIFSGLWEKCDKTPYEDQEIRNLFKEAVPGYEAEVDLLWDKLPAVTGVRPYTDAWLASLKEKGYKLYVLSNYGKRSFEINSQTYDFLKYFDGKVISYQVECVKPNPEIYDILIQKYNIIPENTVFFDDRIENVEAAKSKGICGILFENYELAVKELREKEFEQLVEKIIENRFTVPEETLKLSLELYERSCQVKDYYYASVAKFYEGDAYLSLNKLDKSTEPLLKCISIQEDHGYTDYKGKAYNVLGAAGYAMGDYILAMKYLMSALGVAMDSNDKYTEALISNNIAAVFLAYDDYKNANKFFQKAWDYREYLEEKSDEKQYATTRIHINQAICRVHEKKYEEAKRIFDEIYEGIEPDELKATCVFLWEIAISIYKNFGEDEKAIEFALKRVEGAKQSKSIETINTIGTAIDTLTRNGYTQKAEELLAVAEEAATKSEYIQNEVFVLQDRIAYYNILGDEESAIECYKKYYELTQRAERDEISDQAYAMKNRHILQKMSSEKKMLQEKNERMEKRATKEPLTGLLNRNGMNGYVEQLLLECRRSKQSINLAIIDIDKFKQCNDTYGHLSGDRCLIEIARILKRFEGDKVKGCRFGGDEFFLIGEGYSPEEWNKLCGDINARCSEKEMLSAQKEHFKVTVSIGAYTKVPEQDTVFHDYIHCADLALYKVKENGRNSCLAYIDD